MSSPRIACLTMVKNDEEYLNIWVNYYSKLFGANNCYIVDHLSDESEALNRARAMGLQVIRLPYVYPASAPEGKAKSGKPVLFDRYRFAFLSKLRVALREFYDVVIVHDVDEVLIADPEIYVDFAEYLTSNIHKIKNHLITGGVGVEVFHDPQSESKYDPSQTVLQQRRNAHYRLSECKPAIFYSNEPGKAHGAAIPFALDENLWLLHLKFLDRDSMVVRQQPRFAAVQRGEVPDFTRWAWSPTQLDDELKTFMLNPIDPDTSRMKKFLSKHMRLLSDGYWIVEKEPDAPGQPYEASTRLKAEAKKNLNDFRFVVPDRYRHIV